MEISENMARIDQEAIRETKGEIVVYQPDEITRLEMGSHIRPDFIILMPSYPSAIA